MRVLGLALAGALALTAVGCSSSNPEPPAEDHNVVSPVDVDHLGPESGGCAGQGPCYICTADNMVYSWCDGYGLQYYVCNPGYCGVSCHPGCK